MFLTFQQYCDHITESTDDTNAHVKMSDEDFQKFELRLQSAKHQIQRRFPFFYLVLLKLKTVPTYDIPTMAVDNNNNIYINPNFTLNELSFEETIGVLVHEAFHHVNMTFYRGKNKQHKLWNIATDYIMNRDILEMSAALPSLGLIPKQIGADKWIIPELKNLDITDMTSEELYAILEDMQSKQNGKDGQPGGSTGGGDSIDKLAEKQKQLDEHIKSGEKTPTPADVPSDKDVYKPNDDKDPTTGNQLTDEEKAAKQKSEIAQIAEEIKSHKTSAGNSQTPRSIDFNKLISPKVNWKELLKNFIGKSKTKRYKANIPSRRAMAAGYFAPALRDNISQDVVDNLVIAVDTSGSIPPKVVHTFIGTVLNINRQFKATIRVLFYNDSVYAELIINNRKTDMQIKNELAKIKFTSGGNNEPCIKQYLIKNKITPRTDERLNKSLSDWFRVRYKKIEGFLLFTDGAIHHQPDFPQATNYLFLLTTGGSDDIVKKFGPTYTIDIPIQ